MEIIQKAETVEIITFALVFHYVTDPEAGFTFPCDEAGTVDPTLSAEWKGNLAACLTGQVGGREVVADGVRRTRDVVREPAVGRCDCGQKVWLSGFTNVCDGCGADYNFAGQRLAARSQWGEETGESLADILSIDGADPEDLLNGR